VVISTFQERKETDEALSEAVLAGCFHRSHSFPQAVTLIDHGYVRCAQLVVLFDQGVDP
jgi:hypothetical protein